MQLKTQFWDKEMQSTIPTIAMVGDELKYVAKMAMITSNQTSTAQDSKNWFPNDISSAVGEDYMPEIYRMRSIFNPSKRIQMRTFL